MSEAVEKAVAAIPKALEGRTEPITVREVARVANLPTTTKPESAAIGIALKRLGWRRGQQVSGSKGSCLWWPPT